MVKTYRVGAAQRAVNAVYGRLTRWGLGSGLRHVLTVTGRRTGQPRSTPVDVMEVDGVRYLVAAYGEVNWVRNLRQTRKATLRRGRRVDEYDAAEVGTDEAVPVIRRYQREVPVTRAYWEFDEHADDDLVRSSAANHPVFRLTPTQRSRQVDGQRPGTHLRR
jgi:deazaflavin-dependent oxidoreductase (nitroreductase family)